MPDPVVTEITDTFHAFLLQLRASADIAALVGTRIADQVQDDWPRGEPAIFVREVGGGSNSEIRHQQPRYDVWCLGKTGFQAKSVLRRVVAWLIPYPGAAGRSLSFKQGNCVVYSVLQDGGQSKRYPTQEEPWHAVIQAFVLDASEVPL